MKKILVLSALLFSSAHAQITTIKTLPTNTSISFAGIWTGVQTNDLGQRTQAVNFELTATGEFIMGSAAKGKYVINNNTIEGTFKQFSNNETYSFSGSFDAPSNKLTCTLGAGANVKGQGIWVVSKQSTTSLKTSTIQNTTRITQTNVQPPTTNNTTSTTPPPSATKNPPVKNFRCDRTDYEEYYLISTKLIFYTGNDSKEAPSMVSINCSIPGAASLYESSNPSLIGSTNGQQSDLKYEFKANSNVTVPAGMIYYPCGNGKEADYMPDEVSLNRITRSGLIIDVYYSPNFFMDAWKVERIDVILEFKQPDGTLHSTHGTKIIPYYNLNKLFTASNNKLTLKSDRFLMPIN
ncbi:hypothetical protein [Lacibacter sp. H407]|uniref:hypothetical protein n=1 Tax=Lacibacter sp. H407 TaxID=3133423 RepID=UPI0030BF4A97